ncbi:MAG: AI-2E family transporter [Eubacteriales bacterium]|nr:AI-2E family transporter [Eubacteriales bacterium]
MKIRKLFKFDRKKVSIMLYVIVTVILSVAGVRLLSFSTDIVNTIANFFTKIYNWVQPGIIGIIIAYLLFPLVNVIFKWLTRIRFVSDKVGKFFAILFAYIGIAALIFGFFYAIYISIGGQISNNTNIKQVIGFISDFASNRSVDENSTKVIALFQDSGIALSDQLAHKIADVIVIFRDAVYSFIAGLGSGLMAIGESLISVGLGIILSIYLIKDADYFLGLGRRFYYIIFGNSKLGYNLKIAVAVFDRTFKKYMKGQLMEAFFVAVLSITTLWLLGIKYALLIGIVSGVTNMIPYVGPLMGTILAGVMGILDGSVSSAIIGIVAMQVVQQIDNNILAPKIVGGMVGLHPVFTILALIIGGKYGGIIGMILAVPVAASLKILIKLWFEKTGKNEEWTLFSSNMKKDEEQIEHEIDTEFSSRKRTHESSFRPFRDLFNKAGVHVDKKDATSKMNPETAEPDTRETVPPEPASEVAEKAVEDAGKTKE